MDVHTRLVLPDVHLPFEDQHMVEHWFAFLEDNRKRIGGIDIIGDLLDCYSISKYDKNPLRKSSLQAEVDQAVEVLNRIRKAARPGCDIRFSEGNHEARLTKMLWGKSKELAHLRDLNMAELLDMRRFKITYYEPARPYQIGSLWYTHGDIARKSNWSMTFGGSGAQAVAKRIGGSVMMGHSHQMGHVSFRDWEGLIEGFECGCLCRLDMEYLVGVPQWQQGWAVVHHFPDRSFTTEFVRTVESKGKRRLMFRDKQLAVLPTFDSLIQDRNIKFFKE